MPHVGSACLATDCAVVAAAPAPGAAVAPGAGTTRDDPGALRALVCATRCVSCACSPVMASSIGPVCPRCAICGAAIPTAAAAAIAPPFMIAAPPCTN